MKNKKGEIVKHFAFRNFFSQIISTLFFKADSNALLGKWHEYVNLWLVNPLNVSITFCRILQYWYSMLLFYGVSALFGLKIVTQGSLYPQNYAYFVSIVVLKFTSDF